MPIALPGFVDLMRIAATRGRIEGMATRHTVPPYTELLWPTLQAIEAAGGSASIDEIVDAVIARQGFADEQQAVLHGDGPQTEIEYRLA